MINLYSSMKKLVKIKKNIIKIKIKINQNLKL